MDEEQQALLLSAKPIEYLIRRKFPDWRAVRVPPSLSTIGHGGMPQDIRAKRIEEIDAYRAELQSKSLDDLNALYRQEQAKEAQKSQAKADLEERQRFFNMSSAKADFAHWSRAAHWTLDEAIALALGKDPQVVTWERVRDLVSVSLFARSYAQIRDLAQRAKACQQLYDPVMPGFFLAWAKRTDIDVPQTLVEQVEKRGIVVADWKSAHDKLKTEYDTLLADRDKIVGICQRLIQERDELKGAVAELQLLAWEGFDPDSENYPTELDIAMQAWRAVTNSPTPDLTAKEQIEGWLRRNYTGSNALSDEARKRISVVCNWEKGGGRRRGRN